MKINTQFLRSFVLMLYFVTVSRFIGVIDFNNIKIINYTWRLCHTL